MTFRFRPELQPFEERLTPRASVGVLIRPEQRPPMMSVGVPLPVTPTPPIAVITPVPTPTPTPGGM